MKRLWKRVRRAAAVGVLGMGLVVAPAFDRLARAQDTPEPEPGAGSGRPFDGYAGTCVLLFLALFIVGKSARR
jgi:hypothetical protein